MQSCLVVVWTGDDRAALNRPDSEPSGSFYVDMPVSAANEDHTVSLERLEHLYNTPDPVRYHTMQITPADATNSYRELRQKLRDHLVQSGKTFIRYYVFPRTNQMQI